MSIWQLEGVSNFGPYVDVDCVDKCSKGELRSWRVTIDKEACRIWGTLRRSKTKESDFDEGVTIPERLTFTILQNVLMHHHEKE